MFVNIENALGVEFVIRDGKRIWEVVSEKYTTGEVGNIDNHSAEFTIYFTQEEDIKAHVDITLDDDLSFYTILVNTCVSLNNLDDLHRFKEAVMKVKTIVEQAIEHIKKYTGISNTDKVERIITRIFKEL